MSQGNLQLELSLDTSPAQSSLQGFLKKSATESQKAAKSNKPLEKSFEEIVKEAKLLGATWDATSKRFKQGGKFTSLEKLKKQLKDAEAQAKRTGKSVESVLKKSGQKSGAALSGISSGFKSVLQGIPQGIGVAIGQQLIAPLTNLQGVITGLAGNSVASFAEIDRSLRQVLSIAGESPGRFDELARSMNRLAAETKFTAGELAEASVQLARAGFTVDEVQEALPGIAQGAAAAGESMEGMSDVVIASLGGFQKSTAETTDVVDVLTAAANSSNTSVVELGEGLKYVGPIAKNLGLTLEDTAAVAAVLANNGIKASQMGTALRQGLSRLGTAAAGTETAMGDLSRGTANQAEVLSRLGVELETSQGQLVPFPELLKRLREGFSNLSSLEQGQAAKILFGQESATAFISLLNASADEVDSFFQTTNNATGTAAATAQANLAGISGSLDLLRSAFDSALAQLGSFLSTIIKPLIDGLTATLNVFNNLPGPVQNFTLAIGALTVALGLATVAAVAFGAAANAGVFTTLANGAKTAAVAFTTKLVPAMAQIAVLGNANISALPKVTTYLGSVGTAAADAGAKSKLLLTALGVGTLAAVAAAVGAVALAFDAWRASVAGAQDVTKGQKEINKQLTEGLKELTTDVTENADIWKIATDRVGWFQAQLDRLRRLLGLTTAEEAYLNNMTVALGESMDKTQDRVGALITELDKENKSLGELEKGTEEYNIAAENATKKNELIAKTIKDSLAQLQGYRLQLLASKKAKGELTEEEERNLAVVEAQIKDFQDLRDRLIEVGGAYSSAGKSAQELREEQEQLDLKAIADQAKEASKAATDAFRKEKDEFQKIMDAQEQAFNNFKDAVKEGLDGQLQGLEDEFKGVKEEIEEINKESQKEIDTLTDAQTELNEQYDERLAKIKEVNEATESGINERLQEETSAIDEQIGKVESRYNTEIAKIDEVSQKASARYNAELSRIDEVKSASTGIYDAEIKAINDRQAAADRVDANALAGLDKREEQIKNATESAIAGIEAEKNSDLRALEAREARSLAMYDRRLEKIERQKQQTEAGFEAEKRAAERSHAAVMSNYDNQLSQLDRLKAQRAAVYDQAIDALRELTPAEEKLAALEEKRLRERARAGGEDGLRAQAQLERAQREEQIAQLEKQRAEEQARLEQQQEAIRDQKQQAELRYQERLKDLDAQRAASIQKLEEREAEAQARKEAAQARFQQKEREINAEAEAKIERAQLAEEAALEAIDLKRDEIAENQRLREETAEAERIAAAERDALRQAEADAAKELADEAEAERLDKIAQEKEAREESLARAVEGFEEQKKQAALAAQEEIDAAKEASAIEEDRIRGEQETANEKAALKEKELLDDIDLKKEELAEKEKLYASEVATAKEEAKNAEKLAEEEFDTLRTNLLIAYNKAIGESSTNIIQSGEKAWKTYADNAVAQLARVKLAATNAANALRNYNTAKSAASGASKFAGGPVSGGTTYTVNEFGKEAFLSKSGKLSMIDAPAWGQWRAPSAGTIIPAHITSELGVPKKGIDLGGVTANINAPAAARNASGSNMAALVKALGSARGDTINNSVTIQAKNTTQAASDMLVSLTRIKNKRLR